MVESAVTGDFLHVAQCLVGYGGYDQHDKISSVYLQLSPFFIVHYNRLTKRRHSSPGGFRCANSAYNDYEPVGDLDLAAQGIFCCQRISLFKIQATRVVPAGHGTERRKGSATGKESQASEEMHRSGGFGHTACRLKGDGKLVE